MTTSIKAKLWNCTKDITFLAFCCANYRKIVYMLANWDSVYLCRLYLLYYNMQNQSQCSVKKKLSNQNKNLQGLLRKLRTGKLFCEKQGRLRSIVARPGEIISQLVKWLRERERERERERKRHVLPIANIILLKNYVSNNFGKLTFAITLFKINCVLWIPV